MVGWPKAINQIYFTVLGFILYTIVYIWLGSERHAYIMGEYLLCWNRINMDNLLMFKSTNVCRLMVLFVLFNKPWEVSSLRSPLYAMGKFAVAEVDTGQWNVVGTKSEVCSQLNWLKINICAVNSWLTFKNRPILIKIFRQLWGCIIWAMCIVVHYEELLRSGEVLGQCV